MVFGSLFGSNPVGAMFEGGPLLRPDDSFWEAMRSKAERGATHLLEKKLLGFETTHKFNQGWLKERIGATEPFRVTSTAGSRYEVLVRRAIAKAEGYEVGVRAHVANRKNDGDWSPMTLVSEAGYMSFAPGW